MRPGTAGKRSSEPDFSFDKFSFDKETKEMHTRIRASSICFRNDFQSQKFLFRGERINDNRAHDTGES